jgi:hypothetical protein
MANAKTLPVDDMLREFRIRALTTPPSAIEMTTLDKAMSQILSKTDIPKEAKIQMYNEALNQFRSVRDTVMQKKSCGFKFSFEIRVYFWFESCKEGMEYSEHS